MQDNDAPDFDRSFDAPAGVPVQVSPLVCRLVAGNASPFTFTGTCTYLVGERALAVIDPGPDDPAHVEAILRAAAGKPISHIVVTHTHKDHSPGARLLQARTGAPIVGCGPHRAARDLMAGEANALEASSDHEHRPDREMADGEEIAGDGWTLEAVATPGHTANHLAFALKEENALFSGDHVMAWSTSIVAPPDGSMTDYMASLEKLKERGDGIYWPGHGGPVQEPGRFVRAMIQHRRQREMAILRRIALGPQTIPQLVERLYEGIRPELKGAAALSVLAHLEDLTLRGLVVRQGGAQHDELFGMAEGSLSL